jgi:hypothetical protein
MSSENKKSTLNVFNLNFTKIAEKKAETKKGTAQVRQMSARWPGLVLPCTRGEIFWRR